ncbi:MAG: hypothetical protein K2R93_14900 [Gemmatimonadaceae bacterium]|nr:hypothetical protein [Gemmatimonadaceae bacterium]
MCLTPRAIPALLTGLGLLALSVSGAAAQPVPATALLRRPLDRDSVIQGIPCARTHDAPIELYKASGRLAGCALSTDFTEAGHRFANGTWLDRSEQGVLWGAWLAQDTPLAGHTCRGEGYKAWSTRFAPSGALTSCYLAKDTVIDGVPCMAGSFWREVRGGSRTTLYVFGNGRLKRCQLSRAAIVDGRRLDKWAVIARDSAPGP